MQATIPFEEGQKQNSDNPHMGQARKQEHENKKECKQRCSALPQALRLRGKPHGVSVLLLVVVVVVVVVVFGHKPNAPR